MGFDFARKAKFVIWIESIFIIHVYILILVCHLVFWEYIVEWMSTLGVHTSSKKLIPILLIFYGIFATIWIGLLLLLYHGVKQRSTIKLLVWSLLHFVLLVPYIICAFQVIFEDWRFSPILLYLLYRGFILWVVNSLNPDIIRHRRSRARQIYHI